MSENGLKENYNPFKFILLPSLSTVLEVLQEAKHPFVASITMDPWMVVYNESTSKKVTTPMLSLQSEVSAFSKIVCEEEKSDCLNYLNC